MTDFISDLRKEQLTLADKIAETLFKEIKPYIQNGKFQGLQAYIYDSSFSKPEDFDVEALEEIVLSKLKRDTNELVITYTDWLGARMVRQGNYSVPAHDEINKIAVFQKVLYVKNKALNRVISFMHSQPELPLLGKIENGHFKPDEIVFEQWKSHYDWSE